MTDNNQVAIVTGAAQGIGEAIARDLASRGTHVMLADIQHEKAHAVAEAITAEGGVAHSAFVDVADARSAEAMVTATLARFGRVDALINNGGLDAQPGGWQVDEAHWTRLVDIDLTGQWWCTRAVLPAMRAQHTGKIVFVSSSSVFVGGDDISVAYCAAKSGLIGLTVALSSQLERDGIRVNCLMPGPTGNTGTPMDERDVPDYLSKHPLGFGGPRPLADAVRYLLEPSGDWVSGAVLNVSGGRLRGR